MTESYWPFDSGSGMNINEQQWRGLALAIGSLTPGVLTDAAVAGNFLNPFGDSTGMHVKVDTGRAAVYGHTYLNDSTKTITVGANATGSSRVDAVVVTFDFTANTVAAAVIAGPSGGALPTLTQNFTSRYDVLLGYILVTNGAATITAAMVLPCFDRYAMPGGLAIPVGATIDTFDEFNVPKGWELPVGQTKPNGMYQYPKLWAVAPVQIAGLWGQAVSGPSLLFPDLRGRATVASDSLGSSPAFVAPGLSTGEFGGESTHTLADTEIPDFNIPGFAHGASTTAGRTSAEGTNGSGVTSANGTWVRNNGPNGQPHNNMQPYIGVNKLLRIS